MIENIYNLRDSIQKIKDAHNMIVDKPPKTQLNIELNRRFCDLPSCKKEYKGSGRYCCKEHFLEHKNILSK